MVICTVLLNANDSYLRFMQVGIVAAAFSGYLFYCLALCPLIHSLLIPSYYSLLVHLDQGC
jgi:hypothetical protein